MTTLLAAIATGGLVHLLIVFLVALIAILCLAGLIWAIENWIIGSPLPNPVRLIIGLILVVILIIVILNQMGGT